jgi:DNA polymerase-1
LTTNSGQSVIDLLATNKGINSFEQFESHCHDVERIFWEKRFRVYAQWKEDIQLLYQRMGYIETFLGFRFSNYMGRNECTNYPAQGTAFHILLWTLIHVHEEIKKRKMKSKLIGQIHDSMITDAVPEEVDEVIDIIDYWGTKKTVETFKWIIVPLKIDHELTEVDSTWYDKKEIK